MTALVSFDYGQTLCELDVGLLAERAGERGVRLATEALSEASPYAWQAYNAAKSRGLGGRDAWCLLMETWLAHAGAGTDATPLAEWLWSEQPRKNLWRKPIAGMFELVSELREKGVPLAIVSNSEGRLAELVDAVGLAAFFAVVVDSGKLDFEKPDRRMFELAAEALGGKLEDLIHVGDAWEADVVGALDAGARALWFAASEPRVLPPRVRACKNATDVRRELIALGVL
jgi:putative hydrolase of the HAD superfamily